MPKFSKRNKHDLLLADVFVFAALLGLFSPISLAVVGLSSVGRFLTYVGFLSSLAIFLVRWRRVEFDAFGVTVLCFLLFAAIVTGAKGELTLGFGKTLLSIACVWLIVSVCARQSPSKMIWCIFVVLLIYVLINAMFMFANYGDHPTGFTLVEDGYTSDGVWLLGHKNQLRNWVIPLLCASFLLENSNSKKVTIIQAAVSILGIVMLAFADSFTSALVVGLAVIMLYLNKWNIVDFRLTNSITVSIAYGVGSVLTLGLRSVPFLSDLVSLVGGRNAATFSGRTVLWDKAWASFLQSPLVGNGYRGLQTTQLINNGGNLVTHAHNAMLDTAYKFGIVGCALAFAALALSVYELYKNRSSRTSMTVALMLGAYLLCGLTGELFNVGFVLILSLGYYCKFLENEPFQV